MPPRNHAGSSFRVPHGVFPYSLTPLCDLLSVLRLRPGKALGSALSAVKRPPEPLCGFPRCDLVQGRMVHAECANQRFALNHGIYRFTDGFERLVLVALRVLLLVPKALGDDAAWFSLGDENDLIYKAVLFLQNRQDLLTNGVSQFVRSSGLRSDFDDSGEHAGLLS